MITQDVELHLKDISNVPVWNKVLVINQSIFPSLEPQWWWLALWLNLENIFQFSFMHKISKPGIKGNSVGLMWANAQRTSPSEPVSRPVSTAKVKVNHLCRLQSHEISKEYMLVCLLKRSTVCSRKTSETPRWAVSVSYLLLMLLLISQLRPRPHTPFTTKEETHRKPKIIVVSVIKTASSSTYRKMLGLYTARPVLVY